MKYLPFLIVFQILFHLHLFAENVTIKGKAPGANGKKIRWYYYEDLITFTERKHAEMLINENGEFEMTASVNKTEIAILKIGFFKSTIIIEPEKTYQINFKAYDYDSLYNKGNPLNNKSELDYQINNLTATDINYNVRKFNILFDEFTYRYLSNPKIKIQKSFIDTLQFMIDTAKFTNNSVYFNTIIAYRKAQLEDFLKLKKRHEIINHCFLQKPIAYNNFEYMNFFSQYFNKYLIYNKNFSFDSIITCINKKNYEQINQYLFNDSLLKIEHLRNLIIARNINDIATHKKIKKIQFLEWLHELKSKTTDPEMQQIFQNIIKQNSALQKNKPAPNFILKDNNDKEIDLEKFKGKWIYLNFWATWCTPCISEFKILQQLLPNYEKKLEVISISIDNNPLNMFYYLKNNKFDWNFAHFDNNFELLENYKIKNLPVFILIDPKGNIIDYPAPAPSSNLTPYFNELLNKKIK